MPCMEKSIPLKCAPTPPGTARRGPAPSSLQRFPIRNPFCGRKFRLQGSIPHASRFFCHFHLLIDFLSHHIIMSSYHRPSHIISQTPSHHIIMSSYHRPPDTIHFPTSQIPRCTHMNQGYVYFATALCRAENWAPK